MLAIKIFDHIIGLLRDNCWMYDDKKRFFGVGGDDWNIDIYEREIEIIRNKLLNNEKDERIKALQNSIRQMRLDTINMKNKEIITPMGKSYCNARIQAFTDVLEVMNELWKMDS